MTEIEQLRSVLKSLEYGSCDGCGQKYYCVECRRGREEWSDRADDMVPGKHKPGCSVAIALGSPMGERE